MERSYYKVNEYLLSAIGQWPYQTKFEKILISSIVAFAIISLFLGEILGLVKVWGDMDGVIDCTAPIFFNLGSMVCFIASCAQQEKMMLLFSKINQDWSLWTSGSELEILCKYANQGRKYVTVYAILIYINMFDFLAVPLIPSVLDLIIPLNQTRPRRLIINTDYLILDAEDNYYWIALHACISTTLLMTALASVDSIFFALIYHACGELSILGFVNLICDYFSTAYFLVVGLNAVMMSVTGVQTVINLNKPHDAYTYAVFALGQIFHLFCLILPCQHLMDESIKLSESIYDGYWYEMPLESQKLLLIIIMRNAHPCTFAAGGLYTFSMENFAKIVRTSMSYFTVLSSVREK